MAVVLWCRLSATEFSMKDWKLSKMMKQSGLQFTEGQMLKILGGLGANGCWKHAMTVVEWAYNDKGNKHCKSRYFYVVKTLVICFKHYLNVSIWEFGKCHPNWTTKGSWNF